MLTEAKRNAILQSLSPKSGRKAIARRLEAEGVRVYGREALELIDDLLAARKEQFRKNKLLANKNVSNKAKRPVGKSHSKQRSVPENTEKSESDRRKNISNIVKSALKGLESNKEKRKRGIRLAMQHGYSFTGAVRFVDALISEDESNTKNNYVIRPVKIYPLKGEKSTPTFQVLEQKPPTSLDRMPAINSQNTSATLQRASLRKGHSIRNITDPEALSPTQIDYLCGRWKASRREVTARHDPSGFRQMILGAYQFTCAVSKCNIDVLLDAAHITSYKNPLSNLIRNGICLRTDIHRLFDAGLIDILSDYTIYVDDSIKDDNYRTFHGKQIRLPWRKSCWPSKALLYKRQKGLIVR